MLDHNSWLAIAREDLMAAKGLLKLELFSTVVYHCQQAAEKFLKAYLVFKNEEPIKTHDLVKLIELCMRFDKNFEKVLEAAKRLNPFSTKFRYPSEYDIPDLADAKLAIKQTQKIATFVIKTIATMTTGQSDLF